MAAENQLFFLGVSHRETPLDIRERLAIAPGTEDKFYTGARQLPGVREVVLLNTCNRLEVYGIVAEEEAGNAIEALLCEIQSFPREELAEYRQRLHGQEVIRHLLEVTAGADSQVVGETEIFGQVKSAYADACAHHGTGPILNRLFQKVFHAGKHIRTSTTVGVGQVSIGTIAVELAGKIFGRLDACRVLVVGTGEIAERTARAFAGRGAKELTILSRDLTRATNLASAIHATPATMDALPTLLPQHDIVIGSTTAREPVLSATMVQQALRARRLRPVFLIDLGVPRNFEAATGRIDSVFLYDLDDLVEIADNNRAARQAAVAQCRELALEYSERLWKNIAARLGRDGTEALGRKLPPHEEPSSAGAG